jgi:hypothetical protein
MLKPEPDSRGLVPGIHVFLFCCSKTWMAGSSPAMTKFVNQTSLFTDVEVLGGTYFVTGIR